MPALLVPLGPLEVVQQRPDVMPFQRDAFADRPRCLLEVRAIGKGVPLEGHYVWSLLDNFESATSSAGASWRSTSRRRSGSKRSAAFFST